MSEARKGKAPWNKGKTLPQFSGANHPQFGRHLTDNQKLHLRNANLGKRHTPQQRTKISLANRGRPAWNRGIPHSEEHKQKIAEAHRGPKSHFYIPDRSKLKKHDKRGDVANIEWRNQVKRLDGNKCRMADSDCKGQLEVHHILRWSDFPALRYNVNNGITLCHFHHPRKRNVELQLSPLFTQLVAQRVL